MTRIAGLLEGRGGDLLDAGCGTGQMIRYLRDSRPGDFALTGLDRSAAIIEEARRAIDDDESVRLVVARIEQMPFPADSFDVVLAMGSLEYVASLEQALAEIGRVTRAGGLTVVTMQNPRSPYRLWDAIVWSRVRRHRSGVESPIVRRLDRRQLLLAVAAAGFEPISVIGYHVNLLLPPLDSRFPRLGVWLQRRLAHVARGPFRNLAADYIVVARRDTDTTTRGDSFRERSAR